jgi:hypothetical protein
MSPSTDKLTNLPASSDREYPSCLELGDQLPFSVPPLIEQAQETFHRFLPQLLQERPGQWVAYQGDQLLGFAQTDTELYQKCLKQGCKRGEFLIRSIEPEADEISFGFRSAD